MKKPLLFVLLLGLVIRFFFIGNTGFIADIAFWKSWSLAAIDHGVVWTAHNTNINYPPGFIYVLWLIGKIYSLLGDPHNYNAFWRENNFGFLLAAKSIAILSDTAIFFLIYWFFSQTDKLKKLGVSIDKTAGDAMEGFRSKLHLAHSQRGALQRRFGIPERQDLQTNRTSADHVISGQDPNGLPLFLASVFFLNPVVILDSALWGQVESFGLLFTLIAIVLLFYKRPLLAAAVFTVGTLMKLQNIIYIPIFFLFIYRYFDLKTLLKSIAVAAFSFIAVCFPFILAKDINQVLFLMTVNSDYFPWLSLNAHNLWWIVAGGHGMDVIDKITVIGITNAKTFGLILFASSYLLSCILVYKKPSPRNFLLALSVGIFAFFLFTTESHERYSYPVIVLLLFLFPFLETDIFKDLPFIPGGERGRVPGRININNPGDAREGSQSKLHLAHTQQGVLKRGYGIPERQVPKIINNYFWAIYVLLTLAIFFNIHHGLILNYPQNGFVILSRLSTLPLSILNSYLLIILFFLLLPFVFSQISPLFLAVCFLFFVTGLTAVNFPFLAKDSVPLTVFKPVLIRQDYGVLQINKSVNSFTGWKNWNRLSNNYFFYRQGFGTHANSNLVFDLNRQFRKFTADYGIDTEGTSDANAVFTVYADGRKLFESDKTGRFDFPKHLEVDVTGVKYLGLVTTAGSNGISGDHTDWFNPVLYK